MLSEAAEWLTFIFLIAFFLSVEIYQVLRRRQGRLLSIYSPDIPLGDLFGARARVQMSNGEIVDAEILSCTLCMGRFEVGDTLYVCKDKDKYVVSLPFFSKKRDSRRGLCNSTFCQEETRSPLIDCIPARDR